ncbi:MAG: hypothetical protein C0497_06045 [Gemmatimonas sp.]|nr:hypothetical protein [Gemmatimonas sp.]
MLTRALASAKRALAGDSNDAGHDVLVGLVEMVEDLVPAIPSESHALLADNAGSVIHGSEANIMHLFRCAALRVSASRAVGDACALAVAGAAGGMLWGSSSEPAHDRRCFALR